MIKRAIYLSRDYPGFQQGLSVYYRRTFKSVVPRPCLLHQGPMPSNGVYFRQDRTWSNPLNAITLKKRSVE